MIFLKIKLNYDLSVVFYRNQVIGYEKDTCRLDLTVFKLDEK